MARETKTIQCYPDDAIINERIRCYESFGWELINNQRCQEYDGQTKEYGIDSGFRPTSTTVTHYSTFNKLTFTRDKSAEWYSEVVTLEKQYYDRNKEIDRLNNLKPSEPVAKKTAMSVLAKFFPIIFAIAFAVNMIPQFFMGNIIGAIIFGCLFAGCVLIIVMQKKRKKSKMKKYRDDCARWERNNSARIDKLKRECEMLMEEADDLVNE